MRLRILLGLTAFVAIAVWRMCAPAQVAPDFTLPDAYGREVTLSRYRGNPVLLIFWTTWCGICRRQLPVVDEIRAAYRSKGLTVLGVNLEDAVVAREYLAKNRLYLSSAVDSSGAVAEQFGVGGVPAMVLLDSAGVIKGRSAGYRSAAALRSALLRVGL